LQLQLDTVSVVGDAPGELVLARQPGDGRPHADALDIASGQDTDADHAGTTST
jgi:hypothetical protein